MPKRRSAFYGVRRGHTPGVYDDWDECKRQVTGFPGTEYKGFPTRSQAEKYVDELFETSKSKQESIQSLQVHSDQSEPFKLIEENGQQFVAFQSIATFDKYLDFIRQPANINNCEASTRLSTTWEEQMDDKGRDAQSDIMGFPGSEYKGFPTWSEEEKYVEKLLKVSNSKQESILSVQVHPDQSELFKVTVFVENEYRGSPTHSEAEKYMERLLRTSNLKQDSIQSLQACSHQSELFRGVCQLEFDGAAKGNPGKAGAGALLRCPHGCVVLEMMQSLGIATNNVAEYRSLILGLKGALSKGVGKVRAQGDSKLVCMQVLGVWKVRKEHLIVFHEEVKELEKHFKEFSIMHVEREFNSTADALANNAVNLEDSESVREIQRPIPKCCA